MPKVSQTSDINDKTTDCLRGFNKQLVENFNWSAPILLMAADRIEELETALKKIANDEVTHTKLNQQRLCCKFQGIAMEALENE